MKDDLLAQLTPMNPQQTLSEPQIGQKQKFHVGLSKMHRAVKVSHLYCKNILFTSVDDLLDASFVVN